MRSITELVKGGQTVHFVQASEDALRYTTNDGFAFDVPLDDLGDGEFLAQDKAMLFMRYIRKARDAKIAAGEKDTVRAHETMAGEVTFVRARKGELWYVTNDGFEFPVPFVALKGKTYGASGTASDFDVFVAQHQDGIEKGRAGVAFEQ